MLIVFEMMYCVLYRTFNNAHSFENDGALDDVGTMGVCISPCSLPGAAPMFELGPLDMELGMGMFCMLLLSKTTF